MKKVALSLLCMIALTSMSSAQKLAFRIGGGYGLPLATQSIGQNDISTYNVQTQEFTNSTKVVTASFGSGVNGNIGVTYMFSKFLGADINFQYLAGKKYTTLDQTKYSGGITALDETRQTIHGTAVFINPALIITPGAGSKVPYGRFGVVIGKPKIKGEETFYNDGDGLETEEREWEYSGGTAFGLQGALGLNWMISNNFDIFAEVNVISMTYYPGEYNLTKYVRNDNDQLENVAMYNKKTIFKKEVKNESEPSGDEPREELRQGLPFSSISLQLGVKFTLGGHMAD